MPTSTYEGGMLSRFSCERVITRMFFRIFWQNKAPSTPATRSNQRSTLSKQHSTLLPTATMSNEFIVKF